MERVMNKKDILIETIKILGAVELPMICANAINSIQASIKNLDIAIQLIDAEEKPKERECVGNANADAE